MEMEQSTLKQTYNVWITNMKDYRVKHIPEHDYTDIMGEVVIVPRAKRIDKICKISLCILFILILNFYLWS